MSELLDIRQLRIGDKVDCVASVCGNYGACSGGIITAIRYFSNGECRSWVEIEGCWTPFRGSAATVLVSDLRRHVPEKKEKPLEVGDKVDCTFKGRTYTGWTITSLCGPSMWDSGMVNIADGNSAKTMNYARVPLESIKPHVPEELKVGDTVSATYEDEIGNGFFCHCGKIVERSYCEPERVFVSGEWVQKAPKSGRFTYCFLVLKEKVKKLPEADVIPAAKPKQWKVGDKCGATNRYGDTTRDGQIIETTTDEPRWYVKGGWWESVKSSLNAYWVESIDLCDPEPQVDATKPPEAKEPTFEIGDLVTAPDATYYPGIKCVLGVVKRVDLLGNKKTLFVEGAWAWVRSPATPVFKGTHWVDIDKATKFNSYADGETLLPIPAKPEVKYVPKVGDKARASKDMYTKDLYCISGVIVKTETDYDHRSVVPYAHTIVDVKGTWISSLTGITWYDRTERVLPSDLILTEYRIHND